MRSPNFERPKLRAGQVSPSTPNWLTSTGAPSNFRNKQRHEAARLEAQSRLEAAQKDLAAANSYLKATFAELDSLEAEKRAATAKEVGLPEDGSVHRSAEDMLRFLGMPAQLAVEHKTHLEAWMREVRTIVAGIQAPTEANQAIPTPLVVTPAPTAPEPRSQAAGTAPTETPANTTERSRSPPRRESDKRFSSHEAMLQQFG